METIKTNKMKIKINGISLDADVKVQVMQDEWPDGNFDFGDAEENARYLERFETGELLCLFIQVTVSAEGETGFDSLGMCHVKAQSIDKDVLEMVKDYAMVDNAVKELTDVIRLKSKPLIRKARGES